jgi:hypothetical protein
MPTPEEVLQECAIAFPGLSWIEEEGWNYYEAKTKSFRVELTVQKDGSTASLFVGDTYWRSSVIKGRSPTQALAEIKAIILDLISELQSTLGEK